MKKITQIVLTGGPGGGKSTALKFLEHELAKRDIETMTVKETASHLMRRGMNEETLGRLAYNRLIFLTQYEKEKKVREIAEKMDVDNVVIIYDRGLLDNRAYVTEEEYAGFAAEFGLDEETIRNSYDAVFHLATAADGAESFYGNDNNSFRKENPDEAITLDRELLAVWTGAPHLRMIESNPDINIKLNRLLKEILFVLGIPEPYEIERKFLIEMPDLEMLEKMPECRRVPITQAYFQTPDEGAFRVRKRGEHTYIKTVKKKISEIRRIEIENSLTKEEYDYYMAMKMYCAGVISKDRYCIAYGGTYYELDVYPFWSDKATLEIELLSEDEPYTIPGFVKVIREVTEEKKYRNKAMAVKYKSFFESQ